MAIRAYDEIYLDSAQRILGDAMDFALVTLSIAPKDFGDALAVSRSGELFAAGNPRYVAGMNGCEFARAVLEDVAFPYEDAPDAMYLDRSPEYWAGWALAYYQWHADTSFLTIFKAVSLEEILAMYEVYHEMDIAHFVERMDERLRANEPHTRLYERRKNVGLSQAELAREAGVSLRQIQLYEQGQRDINKAAAITLYKLSKVLFCTVEDLLEPTWRSASA